MTAQDRPCPAEGDDEWRYPTGGFYVAHRRFNCHASNPWGDLLDGPETDDEAVIDKVLEAWKDDEFPPGRDDLRVWYCAPDKPREDCTAWAIGAVRDFIQDQKEDRA